MPRGHLRSTALTMAKRLWTEADSLARNPYGASRVLSVIYLRVVGRLKDVIIRSGHNIDPQLIEDVALAHAAVAQVAAVAMPDEYAGEVPVLFAVLRPGMPLTEEALIQFVSNSIAEPPARPRQVFLVAELPLTPFAKVARYRLRQLAVEYRVSAVLRDIADGITVACRDPHAKQVHLERMEQLSEHQVREIVQVLARYDLQLMR